MTVEAILASCIVAIGHGNSVESCLAAHPEYADRLEPLLRLVAQAHNLRHSQTSHAALIEAILAACIEVIESVDDEKSAGYSLDDYTGYADRLEPLLRALAELYSLPERRMARAALVHGRAFVARAERKRWSHMAQTALTIVPPIIIRVSSAKLFLFPTRRWGHVPESPSSWRLSRRGYGAGMSLAVTAASIMLMVALVLNTAALSLPGDVYYPIKRGSEEVQGIVVKTFGEPAAWHMGQVERRVQELTLMEKSGRSPDPTAVAAVEAEVKVEAQAALANAVLMPELQREKLLKTWSQQLQLYQKNSGESSSVAAALAEPLAIVESVLSNPDNAVALVPTVTSTPAAPLLAPNVLLSSTPSAPAELIAAGGVEELQPSTASTASTEQDTQPAAIASLPATARPRSQATVTTARQVDEPAVANTPSALSIAGIGELLGPGPIPATPTGEVRLALQTPTSTLVAESPLEPVAMVRATATSSEATSPILLPTVTDTPAPVSTATARPTITPTSSRTPLATNTPRPTATPNATATPSPTELLILVPTATPASTLTPTVLPTIAPTSEQTATALPTDTPILLPTATETPTETPTAAASETVTPTVEATDTSVPTETPAETPTDEPTIAPTVEPTDTVIPTETPTIEPTATSVPTEIPTETPTVEPTATPLPTETPTSEPTDTPLPTETPTVEPTTTSVPTETLVPTETPTPEPTDTPLPTETPTPVPTDTPLPTETPTPEPTDTSVPSDTEPPTETATPASADTSVPPDTELLTETPEPELTDTPVPSDSESPTETAEATDEGEPDQSQ